MVINSNFWKSKRVFLTGHTGFKGSWLTILLSHLGAEVCGYSLEPKTNDDLFNKIYTNISKTIKHNLGDIRDIERLRNLVKDYQPDVVFHFAAQPLVIESYKDPISTWNINVMGSLNLLESLKTIDKKCSVVVITTDKVYLNKEWNFGYREIDELGGHDPYSSSKASLELLLNSWRLSFCGNFDNILLASARAGNVIGGGDWSENRIIPDAIRALRNNQNVNVRNPNATRPWQHVLEPLTGYLMQAEKMYENSESYESSFNFGPFPNSNKKVSELVSEILKVWPGNWVATENRDSNIHEANLLYLNIDKATKVLGWQPKWDFRETIYKTIKWYYEVENGKNAYDKSLDDINDYLT